MSKPERMNKINPWKFTRAYRRGINLYTTRAGMSHKIPAEDWLFMSSTNRHLLCEAADLQWMSLERTARIYCWFVCECMPEDWEISRIFDEVPSLSSLAHEDLQSRTTPTTALQMFKPLTKRIQVHFFHFLASCTPLNCYNCVLRVARLLTRPAGRVGSEKLQKRAGQVGSSSARG